MSVHSVQEDAEAADRAQLAKKVISAAFYALASFMITVVNKTVLTTFAFPSYQVLGLGQMIATIVVLWVSRSTKLVQFPPLDTGIARRIWPLPLIYLGNMATGLGGTKELSLPMFTALRRFSILMTMLLEMVVLGIRPSWPIQASVFAMVGGALLAAADDVTYSASGYTLVLLNDAFTAANGVYMKKKLDAKDLGAEPPWLAAGPPRLSPTPPSRDVLRQHRIETSRPRSFRKSRSTPADLITT